MFVLARALTYASLFVGFVLVFVPAQVLSQAGIVRTPSLGASGIAGVIIAGVGALIAGWCILAFIFIGKGTPAPFDPPRRLVIRGPYRYVRNPMYIGAGMALAGAALVYRSLALLGYVGVLFVIVHTFVVLYEEPALRRMFADDYEDYCRRVARWWPRIS